MHTRGVRLSKCVTHAGFVLLHEYLFWRRTYNGAPASQERNAPPFQQIVSLSRRFHFTSPVRGNNQERARRLHFLGSPPKRSRSCNHDLRIHHPGTITNIHMSVSGLVEDVMESSSHHGNAKQCKREQEKIHLVMNRISHGACIGFTMRFLEKSKIELNAIEAVESWWGLGNNVPRYS